MSSNDIADTDGLQISLQNFKRIKVDKLEKMVTFGAGVNFKELAEALRI